MTKQYIDVFNGDADGLCALIQLRLSNPFQSELVTGVKRDINLLKRVTSGVNTHITALDISFEKNAEDVSRLLKQGASIDYIDHHKTGKILKNELLHCDIDLSAEICTSLIVDKKLQGQYRKWALVGAFGDNLTTVANELGEQLGLGQITLSSLQKLGVYLNYNGYGTTINDLFFNPADLYKELVVYDSPIDFIHSDKMIYPVLETGYKEDVLKAESTPLHYETKDVAVSILPNEKWARRVSGVYANILATSHPDRSHAIVTKKDNENYLVSIRAPINRRSGADIVASKFPTGGGRKAAAGINDLPESQLPDFIDAMTLQYKI